ncbi:hypothetical protein B0H21DRAFT_763729 [Amylocystis lapponica]|nr:hypothetical protein B0H21DRAFT_763729 [Amylocystis lapponica]
MPLSGDWLMTRRKNRELITEGTADQDDEDTSVLDTLLEKLRNGDNVGRKSRRARSKGSRRSTAPPPLSTDILLGPDSGTDTADIARDMLARLKSDGFSTVTPVSPTGPSATRRTRRRRGSIIKELSGSEQLTDNMAEVEGDEIFEMADSLAEESTTAGSRTDSDTETVNTDELH